MRADGEDDSDSLLTDANISGETHFSGATPKLADERAVNNRDICVIVIFETVLILLLLLIMTRSIKMSSYMMATILVSFLAALGLGIFLIDVIFGYDAVSARLKLQFAIRAVLSLLLA